MKPVKLLVKYYDGSDPPVIDNAPGWDVYLVMNKPKRDPDWQWLKWYPTLKEAHAYARGYRDQERRQRAGLM